MKTYYIVYEDVSEMGNNDIVLHTIRERYDEALDVFNKIKEHHDKWLTTDNPTPEVYENEGYNVETKGFLKTISYEWCDGYNYLVLRKFEEDQENAILYN